MRYITFCLALFIFASASIAENTPRTHRGFYFNFGAGPYYQSAEVSYFSNEWNSTVQKYVERKEKMEVSNFGPTTLEMKLGRSVFNLLAIYAVFNANISESSFKYERRDYQEVDVIILDELGLEKLVDSEKITDDNAATAFLYGGIGFTFYPFVNPKSKLNGFYIGESFGYALLISRSSTIEETLQDAYGFASQMELGKEWWISDTWAIGVGISNTFIFLYAKESDSDITFGNTNSWHLVFRFTHR